MSLEAPEGVTRTSVNTQYTGATWVQSVLNIKQIHGNVMSANWITYVFIVIQRVWKLLAFW